MTKRVQPLNIWRENMIRDARDILNEVLENGLRPEYRPWIKNWLRRENLSTGMPLK